MRWTIGRDFEPWGPYANVRWLAHTAEAHGLYEKAGFGAPGEHLMERNPGQA